MSLFLGKIHYWLYDKVLLHERLIGSIAVFAEEKGAPSESLLIDSYAKYGVPVTGDLEDNINHANIHGWLQERIFSVEKRLAYVVSELLKQGGVTEDELSELFRKNGAEVKPNSNDSAAKPQELFAKLFDHLLEGMPCDNVNRILESTDDAVFWETTRCLHQPHWEEVGGDVAVFYRLRDSWIKGFLSTSGTEYHYSRTSEGVHTIRKG